MMSARLGAVLCVALSVGACTEHALPSDRVHNEASAIELAKSACGDQKLHNWRWYAVLHEGEWHAWYGVRAHPECAPVSAWIRASDAAIWDGRAYQTADSLRHGTCTVCVNENGYGD